MLTLTDKQFEDVIDLITDHDFSEAEAIEAVQDDILGVSEEFNNEDYE